MKAVLLCCVVLVLGACSNKNVSFVGPQLEQPAYDGTLARVSIYGIADGDIKSALQRTAKQKFQENKNLFSGSPGQLYTLNISVSDTEAGIKCDSTKLSYITKGTLKTNYTLATLAREPEQLFNADIETRGQNETSVLADIHSIAKCGTRSVIATDAVSRSMRIFDLLIKRSQGLDVSKELVQVQNDTDLQGSAIVMRAVSGALYALVVPIGKTVEAAADADWGSAISAAAKAADNMPATTYTPSYTPLRPINRSGTISTAKSPQPRSSPTKTATASTRRSSTARPPTAPSTAKPAARIVKVELQARGTTNMYFPYDQALNLATTNADTQARRQCRESYRGRITSLSNPNMVKKECDENRNEQYRCVVQITHTCEYKK